MFLRTRSNEQISWTENDLSFNPCVYFAKRLCILFPRVGIRWLCGILKIVLSLGNAGSAGPMCQFMLQLVSGASYIFPERCHWKCRLRGLLDPIHLSRPHGSVTSFKLHFKSSSWCSYTLALFPMLRWMAHVAHYHSWMFVVDKDSWS